MVGPKVGGHRTVPPKHATGHSGAGETAKLELPDRADPTPTSKQHQVKKLAKVYFNCLLVFILRYTSQRPDLEFLTVKMVMKV